MNSKMTKILYIVTILICVASIIIGRFMLMSVEVDVLLSFYRVLVFGVLPVLGLVGNFIFGFTRQKSFIIYALLSAILFYTVPIFLGMYASSTGSFQFDPIMLVFAVAPVVVGLIAGFIVSVFCKSHSRV